VLSLLAGVLDSSAPALHPTISIAKSPVAYRMS
jgi:hypothetical protein